MGNAMSSLALFMLETTSTMATNCKNSLPYQFSHRSFSMDELTKINLEIHRLLLEACALADENDLILETNISTFYLNRAGNVGANAVIECSLTILEK
jgi:hypothetical protein